MVQFRQLEEFRNKLMDTVTGYKPEISTQQHLEQDGHNEQDQAQHGSQQPLPSIAQLAKLLFHHITSKKKKQSNKKRLLILMNKYEINKRYSLIPISCMDPVCKFCIAVIAVEVNLPGFHQSWKRISFHFQFLPLEHSSESSPMQYQVYVQQKTLHQLMLPADGISIIPTKLIKNGRTIIMFTQKREGIKGEVTTE